MEDSKQFRGKITSPGHRITKAIEKIAQAKSINLYENFEGIATELYHIHRQNRKCKEVQNRWNFKTEKITQDLNDTKRNSGWGSYRKTRNGKPLHLMYMKKSPPGSYRRVLNRKDVKGIAQCGISRIFLPYMGEHLSPSGGRDLENVLGWESKEPKSHLLQGGAPKKLTKFRCGIQRNCHFFQILGGEFFG